MYANIILETDIDLQNIQIINSLEIVIYRIVQEALNNVAKHSKADRVKVCLNQMHDQGLRLSIKDNGQGFELGEVLAKDSSKRGLGLVGIRERTELSGGTFNIESDPAKGTRVSVVWTPQALGIIS